ncbi:CD276 antigen homolog [Garra rufa]|uniref:CD276 antigen homolog n=1 Tax=Garra rufa TaxID=137080 RepID=UPI003CCEC081
MIISLYFICVFAVLINKVCLQVTVDAVIGGSVVLACSSAEHDLKPQDTDVHWRHNGSKIVFDIVKGKDSVQQQDPRYKNRTETFHSEYLKGNYSLKLRYLEHPDAGKYTCLISHSSEHLSVKLIINEPTTENETKSPTTEHTKSADQGHQKPEQDEATSSSSPWVYIGVLALIIIIIIACLTIIFMYRKKIPAPSFSRVMS